MNTQKFLAVIGDIIRSKNIKDRNKTQLELEKTLEEVNKNYKQYIVSQWTITLGDEFQALMKPNLAIFKMLDYISYKMEPVGIRFGLGLGEIYTDIQYDISIGADGPAYWNAREAINSINHLGYHSYKKISFKGQNERNDLLNNLIDYTEWMKENWTRTQKEVLYTLLNNDIYDEDFKQKILIEELGISKSAVSRRVGSSGIQLYLESRNNIAKEIVKRGRS